MEGGGSSECIDHVNHRPGLFKIVHAYRAGVVTDTAKVELEISN